MLCQVYEDARERFTKEKEKKTKVSNELEKQRNLNKPLHDKKEKAAAVEKEIGAKVEMKVRRKNIVSSVEVLAI